MTSTHDPLQSLRQAIRKHEAVAYSNAEGPCSSLSEATHLVTSSTIVLPKSSPTRWRKAGVTVSLGPSDLFSLEAIYLAWLLKDASAAEYTKQVRENGLMVGFVSVTERMGVVDWLEGKIADHERILPLHSDSTTPPGTPQRTPSSAVAQRPSSTHVEHAETSPSKRRYVSDSQDIEAVKKIKQNEVELKDRNTVLQGVKPNNFSSVKLLYADKLKKLRESSKSNASSTSTTPTPDPKLQARKARNNSPIIIISSSPTALITMHNVKKFLQESTFEPSQEARARATAEGNARPEDLIPIYRKRTQIDSSGREIETQARYYVVDSVEALAKFGADAWDRVVCVMTTGQTWQFKPYKWSDPTQLFHHVKGIYVTWANDPPNTKIQDWNVTALKIEPHRRHVDKSAVAHFWKTLDTWISANKPWLMKN